MASNRFVQLSLASVLVLAVLLGCRLTDALGSLTQLRAGATAVAVNKPSPIANSSGNAGPLLPTDTLTPLPTDTTEPSPTPQPSDTPLPTNTPAPTATRAPTRRPTATLTFTPSPIPSPTRCPQQFCVVKATCIPGGDTRATGHVYSGGTPINGIKVWVANSYPGAPVGTFITGHDPINPQNLDPNNPGYYQVGIMEGAPNAGNWWVFLVDSSNHVISEGRFFNTQDQQTANSCQIGITDFSR